MEPELRQKKIELIFSVIIAVGLGWMLWEARLWPPRTRLFPWSIGFVVWGLSLLKVGLSVWDVLGWHKAEEMVGLNGSRGTSPAAESNMDRETHLAETAGVLAEDVIRRRTISITCWIIVFFVTILLFGLKIGSLLMSFVFLKFAAGEGWKLSVVFSVSTYLFFLIVFDLALAVALPEGLIATFIGVQSIDVFIVRWIWGML